nr:reverse transcriptase domain-containing protein [Tanacetum cinerariifolium]
MAPNWSGVGAAPLMSPRQDKTSESLLYVGWMAGLYRCKDATRGRNDDPLTSGSAWKAYVNAMVAGLFLLVLLEYPNGKGVDETSEPLLYAGWMAGPYWCKDATWGRNDDPVTSGIRAKSDRGGPRHNRSSCSPKSRSKAKSFEGCRSSVRMTMHEVVHEMVVGECHELNSEGSGSAWKAYVNARVVGLFLLSKAKSFEGCRSSVRMTMHEVVHEMVVRECHELNSEGSGSAWKAYMNARVAGLFQLVLLEYPNGKGVVRATSRDSIWHHTGPDNPSSNPTTSTNPNPKGRNRRRSKQRIEEINLELFPPIVTMADQRTMAQLLQEPTEGYEDAIIVPAITADNFELKHGLLTFV